LDPRSGAVRWIGTRLLGAVELEELLVREGARYRDELAGKHKVVRNALERADDLRARGDVPGAVRAYEAMLTAAKRKGDDVSGDAGRALEALVALHMARHDEPACRDALVRFASSVPSALRAPALALGLPCAQGGDVQARGELFAAAEESLLAPDVLADDRSTLFEALHGALAAVGAGDRARAVAERWIGFLEVAAAQARTPGARAAFDPHRVLAAMALGAPERALEAVEASAKDFPEDYNPRARRAALFRALGRDAEALASVDEALDRVRGPRRARVLETKAEILSAASRHAEAAASLHEALVIADGLVDEGRREATMKRIGARLADARVRAFVTAPDDLPPIVQVGDPVLRLRALDVPASMLGTDVLDRFVAIMAAVMRKAPGVGLAAPQIGVPFRLFVFEDTDERMAKLSPADRAERERAPFPFTVVANPSVAAVGADRATFPEGCLSVTGYAGLVERDLAVKLEAVDGQGKALTLELRGWPARIVQHETDHVNGTVYVDRMDPRSFATGENAKRFPLRARPKRAP
jgi:peptide deformylase